MPEYHEQLRSRGRPFAFRPPRPSPGLIRLAQRFSGRFLWDMLRVSRVDVEPGGLAALRALAGQRVILAPNHPSWEPLVLFDLSRQLGMEFNYLCAKEVFQDPPAVIRPWFLQRMGAYSVVRGTADREALRTTRELLVRGERFLVLFPEGEVCWQNDVLLPFQQGGAQMAFWALDDLAKQNGEANLPPLYFLPLAVKYFFLRDMREEIEAALARLERQLGIRAAAPDPAAGMPPSYARLLAIARVVLEQNEARYGIRPAAGLSLSERIGEVRERILGRISAALNLRQDAAQPLRERIRALFNAIDAELGRALAEGEHAYAERLSHSRQAELEQLSRELWRVMHFIAVQGDYVARQPSPERYLDAIGRLETEVFGKSRLRGPRAARVSVGQPLDLREWYAQYKTDKRGALAAVTQELEQRVGSLLAGLGSGASLLHPAPELAPATEPQTASAAAEGA